MLSKEEQNDIRKQGERYPDRRGAIVESLRIVQKKRRWISDESLQEVARCLELSEEEVEHVATFYSLIFRRPVGRHVILICDSVTCQIMGCSRLMEQVRERLGGIDLGKTTPDDRFTLLPVACLGCCDKAPAMMIDEDLHTFLAAEKLDEILKDYS